MLTKGDIEQIRQVVREEVGATEKRLEQKIEREAEDMSELFHETWAFLDKQTAEIKAEIHSEQLKQLEERVARLEKHAGFSSSR